MPFGAIVDALGVPVVLGLGGGLFAAIALAVLLLVPMVRRLE